MRSASRCRSDFCPAFRLVETAVDSPQPGPNGATCKLTFIAEVGADGWLAEVDTDQWLG